MPTVSDDLEPVKGVSRHVPKRSTRLKDSIVEDLLSQNKHHLDASENICSRICVEGSRDVRWFATCLQRLFWIFRWQLSRNGYLAHDRERFAADDRRGL